MACASAQAEQAEPKPCKPKTKVLGSLLLKLAGREEPGSGCFLEAGARCDAQADCCNINQLVAKRATSRALARFNFSLMCARCASTVFALKCNPLAMSRTSCPFPINCRTSNSRSLNRSTGERE